MDQEREKFVCLNQLHFVLHPDSSLKKKKKKRKTSVLGTVLISSVCELIRSSHPHYTDGEIVAESS